jgi:hypothetical protein
LTTHSKDAPQPFFLRSILSLGHKYFRFRVRSVIDVGCGLGGWLRAFRENGVPLVRGVDGNYVDPLKLYIVPDCLAAVDLTKPLDLRDQYDLAVCLEVA